VEGSLHLAEQVDPEEWHAILFEGTVNQFSEGIRARGAIEAALERAHAVATRIDARVHGPFIHLERAELARLTGDAAGAARERREAQRLFAEVGATARAEQVARALA
jgi:hypothetical protein